MTSPVISCQAEVEGYVGSRSEHWFTLMSSEWHHLKFLCRSHWFGWERFFCHCVQPVAQQQLSSANSRSSTYSKVSSRLLILRCFIHPSHPPQHIQRQMTGRSNQMSHYTGFISRVLWRDAVWFESVRLVVYYSQSSTFTTALLMLVKPSYGKGGTEQRKCEGVCVLKCVRKKVSWRKRWPSFIKTGAVLKSSQILSFLIMAAWTSVTHINAEESRTLRTRHGSD